MPDTLNSDDGGSISIARCDANNVDVVGTMLACILIYYYRAFT